MRWVGKFFTWLSLEYLKDYRESRARVYEIIVQNNLRLNTIILTVSVASLTAIATLNDRLFVSYPWLSFIAVGLFVLVILFSTVNFYLSTLTLDDLQKKLNKDMFLPFKVGKGVFTEKYKTTRRLLNMLVMGGFCIGLLTLLILLGFYMLGGVK